MQDSGLPFGCTPRPATPQDIWPIRKLVLSAMLDPTQLRWQQFWVIEAEGQVIACGQLRSFEGAQELGSVVVAAPWRSQGCGSYMVNLLVQQASQPLYLECLGTKLAKFYQRFGFVPAVWQDLPQALKFKFGLSTLAQKVLQLPVHIMTYPGR